MKKIIFLSAVFLIAVLFSSCDSFLKNEFAKRKYTDFPRSSYSVTQKSSEQTYASDVVVKEELKTEENNYVPVAKNISCESSVTKKANYVSRGKSNRQSITPSEEHLKNLADANPKITLKKFDAEKISPDKKQKPDDDVMFVILVVLAILIPPLAVYLKHKATTSRFWLTLILYILAFIIFGARVETLGGLFWLAAAVIALLDIFDAI